MATYWEIAHSEVGDDPCAYPNGERCGDGFYCSLECLDYLRNADRAVAHVRDRLYYLRGEIRGERISLGEIQELQDLAQYIEPDDIELLTWMEVSE